MRQIKFRGLRTDGEGYAFGFYCNIQDKEHYILEPCLLGLAWTEVHPESVGQFTGLHDKNGVDIYEGDMLKTEDSTYAYVVWEDAAFAMKSQGSEAVDWAHSSEYSNSEVIGNIHTQDGGQEG